MIIYLAADHAGFELKGKVKQFLSTKNYEVKDFGAFSIDKNDDYPDFISQAGEAVSKSPNDRAILFGGSGEGEGMVANRFPGVRAVVFYGPEKPLVAVDVSGTESSDPFEIIRLSREHNDANVLSIGARFVSESDAIKVVDIWLNTPFSGNERHTRRIKKIK